MEKNQIITGDCIEILRGGRIADKTIDLVLTDPPYKLNWWWKGLWKDRKYLVEWMKHIWSTMETDVYTNEFMDLLLSKLKIPNIVFFCNKAQVPEILDKAREYNLNFDILVLCKTAPTPLTNWQRLPDREYAIHLHKWIPVRWNYKTKKWFRVSPNFKDTSIDHPTVKPVNVMEDILKNLTDEWDLVLDCYLWSWTTAVACKNTNRNFIGIEINPEYVEIAKNRLKEVDRINQQRLF